MGAGGARLADRLTSRQAHGARAGHTLMLEGGWSCVEKIKGREQVLRSRSGGTGPWMTRVDWHDPSVRHHLVLVLVVDDHKRNKQDDIGIIEGDSDR